MRLVGIGLALLVLAVAGSARADEYDETEHRLKTAGVDEALRERIHDAIRRGVAALRARQQPSGTFGPAGLTALAGLALRHAAIPEGVEAARKAIASLRHGDGHPRRARRRGRPPMLDDTYTAGLLAMLLTADASHADWNRMHHDALAKGPRTDRGYWGYRAAGRGGTPNLSTAQFACLGLWAGERAGAPVATRTWQLHLESLLKAQQQDGSWSYDPGAPSTGAHPHGYPTGTFMGAANLALTVHAIRHELRQEPRLWSRALLAAGIARAALRRHVAWELESEILPVLLGNLYPYYRLYAIEKACVFLDLEDVAGRRWYEEGARRLLDAQRADGGWYTARSPAWGLEPQTGSDVIDTSFALLFLLRASHAYHPVTPRPVGRAPVITPGDDPEPEGPPPAPPVTSLASANALLDELEGWLVQRRLDTPGRALEAFAALARIHEEYRPDGVPRSEPHDAWCRRAEAALLEATTCFVRSRTRHRTTWQAVALHALDTLAETERRVAAALMRRIEGMQAGAAFPAKVQAGWYSAAFDALRRLDAPALGPWLTGRMLSPDPDHRPRTSAALVTLGGVHGLRGIQRHAAAKQVWTTLAPLFRRSGNVSATRGLQIDALVAIRRLARPGRAELFRLDGGNLDDLVATARAWWRTRGRRDDPAWDD